MNLYRKLAFMMGQVGLMMLARYFFQWITKFCTETADSVAGAVSATGAASQASTTPPISSVGSVPNAATNLGTDLGINLTTSLADQAQASLGPIERLCGVSLSGETQIALFSVSLVGTILLLFRIFDGITDPLSGALSDWWVSRGRERRSLLWYSFWIAPIGLILCFAPTHDMESGLKWTLLLSGMMIFFIGYTLYCIPYWSLISDYTRDNEGDQRVLSALLGAGMLTATAIGFVISPLLINALGYGESAWIFALIAAPLMVLPYFAAPASVSVESSRRGSIESAESLHAPEPAQESEPLSMVSSLKLTLNNRRFLGLMFLFAGSQMSLTIMTTAAPFIAEGLLNESKDAVPLLMGPFLGMTLLSFPLVPWISNRFGWERSLMGASIGLSAVYLLTGVLGSAWIGTPMTTAMIIFTAAGPFVGILLGLEGEAITSCAQADDPNRVSMYWGVFNLIVKSLNGLAIWMSALIAARICIGREEFWGAELLGSTFWVGGEAVRSMSMVAGVLLLVGVCGYLGVRGREVD